MLFDGDNREERLTANIVGEEVLALVSVVMFCGMILIWAAILGGQ